MSLKEGRFKLLAELASATAVVLSLVFVGLGVRETARQTELNTEALRVSAYQDLIAQITTFNEALLNPQLAEVYGRMQDPEVTVGMLSPVERVQALRMWFMMARHADMAFYQFQKGLLPEDRLNSALAVFQWEDTATPIYAEFWATYKTVFVPSFQEFIDRRMAQYDH